MTNDGLQRTDNRERIADGGYMYVARVFKPAYNLINVRGLWMIKCVIPETDTSVSSVNSVVKKLMPLRPLYPP